MRFEPTPATTVAPRPSESGDITTAPLRFLKTRFMEQYYAWFLWMARRIVYTFGALAHSLYTRNSLDPQDTEAWKYYYNLGFKQTSTKNIGPGSLLMQVLQKRVYGEKYEIPLGWVRFEPTPTRTAVHSTSESGDITTAPLRLWKNKFNGTVLYLISLNDPLDRVDFWCACAHITYKELSGSTGYWSLEMLL